MGIFHVPFKDSAGVPYPRRDIHFLNLLTVAIASESEPGGPPSINSNHSHRFAPCKRGAVVDRVSEGD